MSLSVHIERVHNIVVFVKFSFISFYKKLMEMSKRNECLVENVHVLLQKQSERDLPQDIKTERSNHKHV